MYSRNNMQAAAVKGLINKFIATHPALPVGFAFMGGNSVHATPINNAVNGSVAVDCIR